MTANFEDLPKDIIKLIFLLAFRDETIININNMKFLSRKIAQTINDCSELYHGKYLDLWYHTKIMNKKGFRSARLREGPDYGRFGEPIFFLHPYDRSDVNHWWWYEALSDYAILPKEKPPAIVRWMD
jgi:hypothetical protein